MANNTIGNMGGRPAGAIVRAFASTIGRGQTSSAVMFTLPPGSTILEASVIGTTNSDAGTSARVSIGSSGGGGKDFLADFNVKTNGASQSFPSSFKTGSVTPSTNATIVTGIYAEDGGASTTGGPWTVVIKTIDE